MANISNRLKLGIATVGILLALVIGVYQIKVNSLNDQIEQLIDHNSTQHEQITVVKNEHHKLVDTIVELSDENTNLQDLVASMKSKPAEIRYVTRTVTKLVASEPTVVYPDLPKEHTHLLNDDIPVAKFENHEEGYKFITYDLNFRNTLVVGKKDSSVLLQVSSSADNVWHEIPADLTVVSTEKKYPTIEPQIHIGLGMNSQTWTPNAVGSISFIHLTPELDILSPGFNLNDQVVMSLYLAGYNIGKPLPIVDDLWLSIGASSNFQLQPGGTIALTSRL